MKRFTLKMVFYFLPLIAGAAAAEYLLRNIPNDYRLKATYYREHGSEIETLILGSSYGFYDFDPRAFHSRTFNGAHVAQTLDLDADLFSRYGSGCDHLKNLIIPVSDASLYSKLYHSGEDWRIRNYTLYYHLPLPFRVTDHSEMLSLPFPINRNRMLNYYLKHITPQLCTDLGFANDSSSRFQKDLKMTAARSVARHLAKDPEEIPEEWNALQQMVAECKTRKINVYLIIPPVSKEYYSTMPPAQIDRTAACCNWLQKRYPFVRFLTFRTDPAFSAADFLTPIISLPKARLNFQRSLTVYFNIPTGSDSDGRPVNLEPAPVIG